MIGRSRFGLHANNPSHDAVPSPINGCRYECANGNNRQQLRCQWLRYATEPPGAREGFGEEDTSKVNHRIVDWQSGRIKRRAESLLQCHIMETRLPRQGPNPATPMVFQRRSQARTNISMISIAFPATRSDLDRRPFWTRADLYQPSLRRRTPKQPKKNSILVRLTQFFCGKN